MIPLPTDDPTDHLKLADWLELYALTTPDGNASAGDLQGALRVAAFEDLVEDDEIERKALDVFGELEIRAVVTGDAYPFELATAQLLQVKPNRDAFTAYIFCLCLSYRGAYRAGKGTQLFEEIACQAAGSYIQGKVLRFGHPRTETELPKGFAQAVDKLCEYIGEGKGYKTGKPTTRKDAKLDIVAWRDFPDKAGSKLMLFGQCAAGADWKEKAAEMHPSVFWMNWVQSHQVSPHVRSFFIPHRIQRHEWDDLAREAGILFDRCRIAHMAHTGTPRITASHRTWIKTCLKKLASPEI